MKGTAPRVPLGALATLITKGTTPKTLGLGYIPSGIPLLRAENIGGLSVRWGESGLFIDEDTDRALSRSRILPDDVLISIAGTIGRIGVVPPGAPPLNCNQAVALVRLGSRVAPRYLAHWLCCRDAQEQIARAKVTATISNLSLGQIAKLEVPLPSLLEQRRIADLLDKADAIRRKRKEAIALTADLLRSAFLDMFGDPVTNPKGWPTKALCELAEVGGGLQVTSARAGNPISLPYLRVANVYRDRLDLKEVKEIRVTPTERERALLRSGDVLVVEGHGNPEELGRAAVWNGEISVCTHQNHLIRVRGDTRFVRPAFLSAFLNSSSGRAQMLRLGKTTSGLNTISTSNVRSVILVAPPLNLQDRFERFVDRVRGLALRMQERRHDEDLFQSLVVRAFSGRLQVSAGPC